MSVLEVKTLVDGFFVVVVMPGFLWAANEAFWKLPTKKNTDITKEISRYIDCFFFLVRISSKNFARAV